MSWKLIDKPKTVKVTKKIAQQFVDMEPAPHDRPLSERRMMVYERILRAGGFRPVTWASVLCRETEEVYRVNGKHTSNLLLQQDPMPEFYAVIEEYECDTLDDVARLYSTFDSGIQSRNARDIYMSFAATVPELASINNPGKIIPLCVAGMSLHLNNGVEGSKTARSQPADRAELLLEHPDFVLWVSGILSGGPENQIDKRRASAQHLRRSPVIAAMQGSYNKSRQAAEHFWSAVRDETGATPELPDRKLTRFLLTSALDSAAKKKAVKGTSTREMYVKCIHAWNAWRRGEKTSLQYYSEKEVPNFR